MAIRTDALGLRPDCRHLRALALVHTLAELAACRHSAYAVNRWYEELEDDRRPSISVSQWHSFFNGSNPNGLIVKYLSSQFTDLDPVWNTPLWDALAFKGTDIERFQFLRNNFLWNALKWDEGKLRRFIRGCAFYPSLDNLGCLLWLLRLPEPEEDVLFSLIKQYLLKVLPHALTVACVFKPLSYMEREFYWRIQALKDVGALSLGGLRRWPASQDEFSTRVVQLREIVNGAREMGFMSGSPIEQAALLWMMTDPKLPDKPRLLAILLDQTPEIYSISSCPELRRLYCACRWRCRHWQHDCSLE